MRMQDLSTYPIVQARERLLFQVPSVLYLLLSLLTLGISSPGATLAAPLSTSLSLELSPGTTYRSQRSNQELVLTFVNNKIPLRQQLERVSPAFIMGMLVLSGPDQEDIVRLTLSPGVSARDRFSRVPARLVLELSRPGPARSGGRSRVGLPRAVEPTDQTLERLEELPLLTALQVALEASEPPRPPVNPALNILCLGSRVTYPVPLPDQEIQLQDWEPATAEGFAGAEKELVERAIEAIRGGDALEGLRELTKFERRFPESPNLATVRFMMIETRFQAAEKRRATAILAVIERLRNELRRYPREPSRVRSIYMAGRAYLELEYPHEAATMLRDALAAIPASDPNRVKALVALGWADMKRLSLDDSLLAFRTAFPALTAEQQPQILLAMATVMAQKGWYDHVLKLLKITRRHFPASTKDQLYRVLEAESLYRRDQIVEARTIFEQLVVELGKSVPRLYEFRIGEALLIEQRYKEARRQFIRPSVEPSAEKRKWQESMQTLRMLQMDMIVDRDSPMRLLVNLEKMRKLRLDNPFPPVAEEVTIEFIKFYLDQNNLPDALGMLRTFMSAHRSNPHHDTMVDRVWGRIKQELVRDFDQGELVRMLGVYERAYSIVAGQEAYDADVTYMVARAYMRLGLFEPAYKAVTEAFFVETSRRALSDRALLMLAEIQRGQKHFEEAHRGIAFLRKRTGVPESLRAAMLEEARIFEAEGKVTQALQSYRAYAALEPDLALRVQELTYAGSMLTHAEGCAAAVDVLGEAAALARQIADPVVREKTADTFYRQGECLFSVQRYVSAAEALVTALSRGPNHVLTSFARYAIARAYLAQGRRADAELLYGVLAREQAQNPEDPWIRMAAEEMAQFRWSQDLAAYN